MWQQKGELKKCFLEAENEESSVKSRGEGSSAFR